MMDMLFKFLPATGLGKIKLIAAAAVIVAFGGLYYLYNLERDNHIETVKKLKGVEIALAAAEENVKLLRQSATINEGVRKELHDNVTKKKEELDIVRKETELALDDLSSRFESELASLGSSCSVGDTHEKFETIVDSATVIISDRMWDFYESGVPLRSGAASGGSDEGS